MIALHQEATNLGRRLTKIRKGLITQLADQLGYDNHTDEDGGTWSLGHRRKRSCVNPQALAEWLGEDWPKAYNLGTAKITALRTLARQRGLDPGAVETSFFDDEWQIAGLRYTPPKGAPMCSIAMLQTFPSYHPNRARRAVKLDLCDSPHLSHTHPPIADLSTGLPTETAHLSTEPSPTCGQPHPVGA